MNNTIIKMAELFKALGDVSRLKIIKILASHESNTFCVSQIAEMLGITQPAVSQHMSVLKKVGLLNCEQNGKKMFYSIDGKAFRDYYDLVSYMFDKAFIKCDEAAIRGDIDCKECLG